MDEDSLWPCTQAMLSDDLTKDDEHVNSKNVRIWSIWILYVMKYYSTVYSANKYWVGPIPLANKLTNHTVKCS